MQSVHYFSWYRRDLPNDTTTVWVHVSDCLQKWTSFSTQNHERYAAYEIFLVAMSELYYSSSTRMWNLVRMVSLLTEIHHDKHDSLSIK